MIEFDSMKLGSCCNCGREDDTVRCVVTIELRSPEPGNGCWGCLVCGLPQAGAVAVLCDECANLSIEPKSICLGFPGANRRLPFSQLTKEPFCHDAAKHAEESEQVPQDGELFSSDDIKVAVTNYLTSIMQWRERHGEPLLPEAELTEFAGQLADEIIKHLNQILQDLRTLKLRERHGRN